MFEIRRLPLAVATIAALPIVICSAPVGAQTKPLAQQEVDLAIDSGLVQSKLGQRGVIYSQQVKIEGAPWVRLQFAEATLGEAPIGGQPTLLRVTATLDGAVQFMQAVHLQQWSNTTAYFNGDSVVVEIIADPGAMPSRLAISGAWVGIPEPEPQEPETICFGTDDRVLSNEAANARLMSVGCTAWIISDASNCLLTAGHCTTSSTSVVQFNVPLSTSTGTPVSPPPEHQYAVDLSSVQFVNGGVGNDWKYFGCHPNSNTGLTPYQAQQAAYNLASAAPPVTNQQIRITGYGTVSAPVSPTWNQVQKTHTGPYFEMTGNTVKYQTDTTGGNSGSPVFNMATGLAIGIHTHGGCTSSGGANQGTAIHHPGLQNALANPLGVCFPQGFTIQVTPTSQAVCAPNQALYTVNIGVVGGNMNPVTLSANNIPAGATAQFSVNPVIPGGSSTLTIGNTANATPGTANFQVVGNNGTFVHQTSAQVGISTALPAAPILASPPNGATNVAVLPTLTWNAAPQALSYSIEVASDAGFASVVYTATTNTTSHILTTSLSQLTQYFWRVRATNTCGTGPFSSSFSFTTMDLPPILLVDDDDNSPNVRPYYTAALNALGVTYDIWDVANNLNPEPTNSQMAPYDIIIWFSGDATGGTSNPKAGPKAASEVALQQWLNEGGCFFLSSEDYLWDRIGSANTTPNAFMQNYLGMGVPIAHDQNYTAINAGLNVFAGLGPWTLTFSSGSGGPGMSNFSDRIPAGPNAQQAFTYGASALGAAVTRDGTVYRTSFWGFPLEAIPTAADRAAALAKFLAWCGKIQPKPCPPDVNGDGQVNVTDLVAVTNAWGACAGCAADVTGDNQVNVADLLAVINAWGSCK